MALRSIFADSFARGSEDGSFIDGSLIDVLFGAFASDHDGDEIRSVGSSWRAVVVLRLISSSFRW